MTRRHFLTAAAAAPVLAREAGSPVPGAEPQWLLDDPAKAAAFLALVERMWREAIAEAGYPCPVQTGGPPLAG